MSTVFVKSFEPTQIIKKEILRYAGSKNEDESILKLLDECLEEVLSKLTYKVCYCEFPVDFLNGEINLGFTRITSEDLRKNLEGCSKILLFAATVGIEVDRLIAKYAAISPVKALLFQAIGAERIESLCDKLCNELEGETKPRFSPGYGDLPVEFQKDIFRVLMPEKRIGLMLNESMLMSPSKSVTAIVGIKERNEKL